MKQIVLKQIEFLNFKGLGTADKGGRFTVNFDGAPLVTISGRNALGKSSIFDGFTWCLFGKDSHDRKSFNIKTLGANGKPIERIPHEVKVILSVNGEQIEITRRYDEKWTRKRGTSEEVFEGHEETRLYNDVPCSTKEFAEKIAAICSEDVFKYITNPLYFNQQKDDVKRTLLFRMAGTISDDELAANNSDFTALLAQLQGKTLTEYQKEVAAKKKRIKDEMQTIPARIDECKRNMPAVDDFEALERELNEKTEALRNVDLQLADISTKLTEQDKATKALYAKKHDAELAVQTLYSELQRKYLASWQSAFSAKNSADIELSRRQNLIQTREQELAYINQEIADDNQKLADLRKAYSEISAEQFVMSENDRVCPTCGQILQEDAMQAKFEDLSAHFNADKSARLTQNVQQGKSLVEKIKSKTALVDEINAHIATLQKESEEIKQSEAYTWKIVNKPDVDKFIQADEAYICAVQAVQDIDKAIAQPKEENAGNDDLLSAKQVLQANIDELKSRLAAKAQIETTGKRIQELETEYRKNAELISQLEKTEFTISSFKKARVEAVESRINGLFSQVRFKMYDQQINGGEVECCEAMIDGVPYSDANNAAQINAGLDIINAICNYEQITAPIFIDNAESVNQLLHTQSQVIRLVVSTDDTLQVQTNNE